METIGFQSTFSWRMWWTRKLKPLRQKCSMRYKREVLSASNYFIISLPDLKLTPQSKIKMVTLSFALTTSPTLCSTYLILLILSKAERALSDLICLCHLFAGLEFPSLPFQIWRDEQNYIFRLLKFGEDLKSLSSRKCLVYNLYSRNVN